MQHPRASGLRDASDAVRRSVAARAVADDLTGPAGGITARGQRCYGIQVLIAGRRKGWRDRIGAQMRRAGYSATTVDCAVDALTVLVLGLPIDVLVTDTDLYGELRSGRLAIEARALRPNLGIVLACDAGPGEDDAIAEQVPDARVLPAGAQDALFAVTVREAIPARV